MRARGFRLDFRASDWFIMETQKSDKANWRDVGPPQRLSLRRYSSSVVQRLMLMLRPVVPYSPVIRERSQKVDKNSSGDEIANVNFYAVRPEATRIR